MIQTDMHLKARAHLASTILATTGLTELAATANGYTRADDGSFLDDGFVPGFEITPVGFPQNPIDIVKFVTDDELVTEKGHTARTADDNRSLTAKPPRAMRYGARKPEDIAVTVPYWWERWLGGPSRGVTSFARDAMRTRTQCLYEVNVFGRVNDEDLVVQRSADAIGRRFGPSTEIVLPSGYVMTVPATPLAAIGQVGRDPKDGRPRMQVTITLRATHLLVPAAS